MLVKTMWHFPALTPGSTKEGKITRDNSGKMPEQ